MEDGEEVPGQEAMSDRMTQQLAFLVEADKLKTILRRTPLADGSRLENSAEHSWHLALAAMMLVEYAPAGVDLARVIELVVIHDLVEIDAGDTFAYDPEHALSKAARERDAADCIFGLLPAEQGLRVRALWEEFEGPERLNRASPTPWTASRRCCSTTAPAAAAGRRTASGARRCSCACSRCR